MAGPARYCPACFAVNAWSAATCEACGASLADVGEGYDDRLIWALGHPDTATAMLAADLLTRRGIRRAIPELLRLVDDEDPYRAQAAARALAVFVDDPRVQDELPRLHRHPSVLVRRAFEPAPGPERAPPARP